MKAAEHSREIAGAACRCCSGSAEVVIDGGARPCPYCRPDAAREWSAVNDPAPVVELLGSCLDAEAQYASSLEAIGRLLNPKEES